MVKLTLVIPYYETYELTCKLLDVLVPQITEDMEVYLIDDGCHEERLDVYDKINIIHLEQNGGNSVALNTGIRKAKGKYIGIIDSDDMITEDYVEELLKAIDNTEADLIYLDWKDMNTGRIIHRPNNYAPWRSIYKKEIIPFFVEGRLYSNDVPFQEEIESKPRTRYYIDKVLYIYNSNRVNSLTWKKAEILRKGEQ